MVDFVGLSTKRFSTVLSNIVAMGFFRFFYMIVVHISKEY